MDPIILLVLILFILLALFAIGRQIPKSGNSPAETQVPDQIFEFRPDTENISPTVHRATRIVAPAQQAGGKQRRVVVQPMPIADLSDALPPPGKGIEAILSPILNPSVRFADSEVELYDFDPPLTVVVSYQAEDEAATSLRDGMPQLSLATVYRDDTEWKFERLVTTINPDGKGGGTLTAALGTLHPQDPLVFCRP